MRDGRRLIAVVLGDTSEKQRADDNQSLLDYGFRFYETRKLFAADTPPAVPVSQTTTGGYPTTTPPTQLPPYSSGPTLPTVGQNCHTVKVCISVSCSAYDSQGKCLKQECTAWEDRVVCK